MGASEGYLLASSTAVSAISENFASSSAAGVEFAFTGDADSSAFTSSSTASADSVGSGGDYSFAFTFFASCFGASDSSSDSVSVPSSFASAGCSFIASVASFGY